MKWWAVELWFEYRLEKASGGGFIVLEKCI
jgi:hypothetical protein